MTEENQTQTEIAWTNLRSRMQDAEHVTVDHLTGMYDGVYVRAPTARRVIREAHELGAFRDRVHGDGPVWHMVAY